MARATGRKRKGGMRWKTRRRKTVFTGYMGLSGHCFKETCECLCLCPCLSPPLPPLSPCSYMLACTDHLGEKGSRGASFLRRLICGLWRPSSPASNPMNTMDECMPLCLQQRGCCCGREADGVSGRCRAALLCPQTYI